MEEKGGASLGFSKNAATAAGEQMGLRILKVHICLGLCSQRNLLMSEPKQEPWSAGCAFLEIWP